MPASDLPDLNIWLALADPDHQHHSRARRYWESEALPKLAFCRVTMLGLLRLLTHPKVMRGAPFTPAEAWQGYRRFRALPEVTFLPETTRVEAQFAALTDNPSFSPTVGPMPGWPHTLSPAATASFPSMPIFTLSRVCRSFTSRLIHNFAHVRVHRDSRVLLSKTLPRPARRTTHQQRPLCNLGKAHPWFSEELTKLLEKEANGGWFPNES